MRSAVTAEYGEIRDAAIAVHGDRIAWVGRHADLPIDLRADRMLDGAGAWVTPGMIDCPTHIVYAGNRSDEFEARLAGASYAEIAQRGGGIVSTVRATRGATGEELFRAGEGRGRGALGPG